MYKIPKSFYCKLSIQYFLCAPIFSVAHKHLYLGEGQAIKLVSLINFTLYQIADKEIIYTPSAVVCRVGAIQLLSLLTAELLQKFPLLPSINLFNLSPLVCMYNREVPLEITLKIFTCFTC